MSPPHTHTPPLLPPHTSAPAFPGVPVQEPMNCSVSFFSCEKAHFISFVCIFFFCLKKFAAPEGVGVGGRGGVTNRPGGWPAWARAANLRTFSLQSLFKESEMLLISFYRFHLSPVSPSSFSLLTTRFLLLFTPCCFTFFLSRHSSLVQWKSRTVYCSFLFVSPLRVTVIC